MGRHLGDLGKARERGDTFGWFGHTIRVGESFSDLRVIDLMDEAGGISDDDALAQTRALRDFLRSVVHPEDWDVFWDAALANGQSIADLMALIQAITEASTGRPTQRRSDSSAGRHKTKGSSKEDSSSRVMRRLEKNGRADLAVVVEMADQARSTG